jgi:hypothetical protein
LAEARRVAAERPRRGGGGQALCQTAHKPLSFPGTAG